MAINEYLTLTLPQLVERYRFGFIDNDPFFKEIKAKRKVIRAGGTKVRIRRVIGRHSDISPLDATNFTIPIARVDTFTTMEGDWGKFGFPIVFPHHDRDRLPTPAERKRWIDATTRACIMDKMIGIKTRVITGALRGGNATYGLIGTLNGSAAAAALAKTGFTNGALRFETPATQAAGATTYLELARSEDTTNDTNHWHNQYIAHNGIGVDFLETVEELKAFADDWDDPEEGELAGGISMGLLSIANWRKLSNEARTYPGTGGVAAVHYTVDDMLKGRTLPKVTMVGGVRYLPIRQMQTSSRADNMNGPTEPCLLINPGAVEYWINAGNDMKVGKSVNLWETQGTAADVSWGANETQFAVPNLQACACTSKA